ncbi:spore coat U domain-containing protein [Altererythrobacter sp. TH136]|uniref:Csu type fimbrial protein n=1 Tax=Altererythrobacter sp. TH136 TaxID=2067415 RepID=UPI00116485A5|nr:spore coat U domain-containing protein [Altererythrobacter sp. TH136]QDM41067.1 spore coat protein U domain-containing protein [Altererythrobacter sp. TH136]
MQGRLRHAIAGAGAAAVLASGTPALAGTTTNTLPVRVQVTVGCTLQTRPLMFDATTISNQNIDSTTTITVRCTPNTDFTVEIDKGLYANGINRRMFSTEANGYVTYDVYRDSPRNNVWGTGQTKNVTANSGSGLPLEITLFGRITKPGTIKAGDYKDTLLVTLNF